MARITLQGASINTCGDLPAAGDPAPDFLLTKTDLSDFSLAQYRGKKVVLNIFPSIDTPVCSLSVERFNHEMGKRENAVVLCASRDLPFAHARFCAAKGIEHVVSASEMRDVRFGESYGVRIIDGPMEGLLARAVVVIDEDGKVLYSQLVGEIADEPDYDAALAAV
jgi:thioredoxin-dependent peroxiredoxin